jgi:hypothetical protein
LPLICRRIDGSRRFIEEEWMNRSRGIGWVLCGLLLAASAWADDCQPLHDATIKVLSTPNHVYTTQTADFLRGKTRLSESIHINGAIYVNINGKWTRSRMTAQDMAQQEQENWKNSKVTCQHLRDESVNGEAAALYNVHTVTEDTTTDAQVWISKSKGVPLHEELDMNVGGMAGKSHMSMRYDYANVQPPAGVP